MTDTATPPGLPDALSKLDALRDVMAVRRVFGDAYQLDGVDVIPVAAIRGGGGGGGGMTTEPKDAGSGAGVGFGVDARPVGVLVVKDGDVSWRPTVDVTRVMLNGQQVAMTVALALSVMVIWRGRRRGRG